MSEHPADSSDEVLHVDSRGRLCPLPIIDLARASRDAEPGTFVELLADDPAAASDVAAWCAMRDHELLTSTPEDDGATRYRVRLGLSSAS